MKNRDWGWLSVRGPAKKLETPGLRRRNPIGTLPCWERATCGRAGSAPALSPAMNSAVASAIPLAGSAAYRDGRGMETGWCSAGGGSWSISKTKGAYRDDGLLGRTRRPLLLGDAARNQRDTCDPPASTERRYLITGAG